jgi:hypothetical protein
MLAGVPAGATRPKNVLASASATPASVMVGTSGKSGVRVLLATASARNFPSRMSAPRMAMFSSVRSTALLKTAVLDSPPLR